MKKEELMKTTNKSFAIIGLCNWAKIQKADENDKFTIDVDLDDQGIKLLESLGMEPRQKEGRNPFFSPWKHAKDLEGNPRTLTVLDKDGKEFKGLVGNGSKVAVEFLPKEWDRCCLRFRSLISLSTNQSIRHPWRKLPHPSSRKPRVSIRLTHPIRPRHSLRMGWLGR
jgi:hypothetical protein